MKKLLIIICLILTACGGHTGKKLKHQPFEYMNLSFDFGIKDSPKIIAYLVTDEKSNANYSRFEKESDIYPWFNIKQLNRKPQFICYEGIKRLPNYKSSDCLTYFEAPHIQMQGTWYINQIFEIKPWGIMTAFNSSILYIQLIQYDGDKYQTAIMTLLDFKSFLKDLKKLDNYNPYYDKALKITSYKLL